MTQVLHCVLHEVKLAHLHPDAILLQLAEDLLQVPEVFVLSGSGHQYVINTYNTLPLYPLQDSVHHFLEQGWSRCNAKWESGELVKPFVGVDHAVLQ